MWNADFDKFTDKKQGNVQPPGPHPNPDHWYNIKNDLVPLTTEEYEKKYPDKE